MNNTSDLEALQRTINTITVLAPRWHDRRVLVASWRVVAGRNMIVMPKARNHPVYFIYGTDVYKYPVEMIKSRAGKMLKMYSIPLEDLEKCATPFDDRERPETKTKNDHPITTEGAQHQTKMDVPENLTLFEPVEKRVWL